MKPAPAPPLSFAHLGALEIGPPQLIDLLAQAGFASTGIRTRRTAPGSPEYSLSDPHLRRETKRRIAATGVTVLYIELVALSRALDVRALTAMFETGADIGATRVAVAGDEADFSIVAEILAAVCELAREYAFAVDLEFMPFRAVRSLDDAVRVLALAQQPNAHILLDALHFYRSGSSSAQLRSLDRALLGTVQLCDAPATPPADLMFEARNARLLPGKGGLPLDTFMDDLPADLPIGVEVPLNLALPDLTPLARVQLMARETQAFLARRPAKQ
jgi:sugar phosphate isomerase/epimerase